MRDRIEAMLESCERELGDINERIEMHEQGAAVLRERRREVEEEIVEARATYDLLRDTGLKVERNGKGVIVASINEVAV